MSDLLTLRARLAAPVEAVRRALTDPAELRVWFAEHAEVDLPHRYAFWSFVAHDTEPASARTRARPSCWW